MSHRRGTESGFVGEHAAGHTHSDGHHHGRTGKTAFGGRRRERFGDNPSKNAGKLVNVQDDDDKGDEDVYHRHGGHDLTGHGTDALHAADEDSSGQQEDGDGGKPRRDGEVGLYGFTDGVALYHSARTDTGDDAEQRKARAEPHPLGSEPVFDEVHGAAHPVSGRGLFAEMHGKEHFAELGGHTHKGGHPHPEQRAGAADVNGCRHAHDVAGPDVGGQRGHQRVERRDFALLGLIGTPGPQVFEPSKKIAECEKFQADSQIQASTDQQYQHPRSPNHVVD